MKKKKRLKTLDKITKKRWKRFNKTNKLGLKYVDSDNYTFELPRDKFGKLPEIPYICDMVL